MIWRFVGGVAITELMPSYRGLSQIGIVALAALLGLGGCGSARLFADYPAPGSGSGSARLAQADWPRLIDTPTRAEAQARAPDPATGAAIVDDLTAQAAASARLAARLAAPVAGIAPGVRTIDAVPPAR